MLKVSFFRGETEAGPTVVPLFNRTTDGALEKTASSLLPEVVRYIDSLRPRPDAVYNLVNAMGAGEYFGSNINGDYFPEAALIHRPDRWDGNPVIDKIRAKDWPYGFPTFYFAHPYAHHRNKDASRAFGEVELAAWNDRMKRVELVTRCDKDKCLQYGGAQVWDKLIAGMFPDVSMGCVKGDTPIVMADGSTKPIRDVRVGDLVLTHLGRARRVTEVFTRAYSGTAYLLQAESHESILCTRQHPWFAAPHESVKTASQFSSERKWRAELMQTPDWVDAEQLVPGDHLFETVLSETETPEGVTADHARLLGYYLADGYVLRDNGALVGVEWCVNKSNPAVTELPALLQRLGCRHPPTQRPHARSEHAVHIRVTDAELAAFCLEHCGSHAKDKRLSHSLVRWDVELQRQFLGAYANGDGCYAKHALKFSTASRALSSQIVVLLQRLGIPASVNVLRHRAGGGFNNRPTEEYVVHVGAQWAQLFLDVCAKVTPHLPKKTKVLRKQFGQYFAVPIRSVTPLEVVSLPVYNLEVEEDHSYLVDGIASHNCKVPYDTCAICLDWKLYREAQATFDPKKHKHPGEAVLAFHKNKHKIRGLSITRVDYCDHAKKQMNRILPDGRKVFVYNDYPRFFDISFVFIGADKTAKTMMKIAGPSAFWDIGPSAEMAEKLGYSEEPSQVKTASALEDLVFEAAFGKNAKAKKSEIIKDVIPSQFAGKAIPALNAAEQDLPRDLLNLMGRGDLKGALASTGGLGIVLRPREFQRIILVQLGAPDVADELDMLGEVFPKTHERAPLKLDSKDFILALVRLLLPFLMERSAIAPALERRLLWGITSTPKEKRGCSSLSSDLLRKIGAAYNSYRDQLMELTAHTQDLLKGVSSSSASEFRKLSSASPEEIFSPLSVEYLNRAFIDEQAEPDTKQARAGVERGFPSRNT